MKYHIAHIVFRLSCFFLASVLIYSCDIGGEDEADSDGRPKSGSETVFDKSGVRIIEKDSKLLISYPSQMNSFGRDSVIIEPPVRRIALSSTTYLNYFESLGQLDKVVACAWLDFVKSDAVQERIAQGELKNITKGASLDLEAISRSQPDLFLYDPREAAAILNRLESLGIDCLPFLEYQESNALDRAEWIKLVGLLTEEEEKARDEFERIEDNYQRFMRERAVIMEDRPSVILLSYYQGTWSAAGPKSLMADLIRDAGGEYVLQGDEVKNVDLDIEEMMTILPDLDFLGVVHGGALTRSDILSWDKRLGIHQLDSLNLFAVDTYETDYFGKAVVEPHLILSDISRILSGFDTGEFHYFRPLDS